MYYRECPNCGCSLDPGEKCDCKETAVERKSLEQLLVKDIATGQMTFRWTNERKEA